MALTGITRTFGSVPSQNLIPNFLAADVVVVFVFNDLS